MKVMELIEIANLPHAIWLTLWDIDRKEQANVEIGRPEREYRLGEFFSVDMTASKEHTLLAPISEPSDAILRLALLPLSEGNPTTVGGFGVPEAIVAGRYRLGRSAARSKMFRTNIEPNTVRDFGAKHSDVIAIIGK